MHLDTLAIEKEQRRLEQENTQLKAILKQFLDGVSVNEDVLKQPNPLLVINGKVNLNHLPVTAGRGGTDPRYEREDTAPLER